MMLDKEDEALVSLAVILHHRLTFSPALCVTELCEVVEGPEAARKLNKLIPPSSPFTVCYKALSIIVTLTLLPFCYVRYMIKYPCIERIYEISEGESPLPTGSINGTKLSMRIVDAKDCDTLNYLRRGDLSLLFFPAVFIIVSLFSRSCSPF